MTIPKFVGSFTFVSASSSEICEVCHSGDELVPHVGRGIAIGFHGSSFVKEGTMKAFGMSIVCRCVRRCKQM